MLLRRFVNLSCIFDIFFINSETGKQMTDENIFSGRKEGKIEKIDVDL